MRLSQKQIKEPAADSGGSFDELQVFRAEHDRPQRAEIIGQLAYRLCVETQFSFAGRPIHFHVALALADDFGTDKITFRTVADHLRAAHAPERAECGEQVNRFEDVGLALRVVAEQQVEAW